MNCQKFQNEFDDRLDGRLDPARAQEFDAHTADCPGCRSDWQAYQAVWKVLRRQSSVSPSFGFAERTLRRLHAPAEQQFWHLPIFRWATALSLLALISATGVLVHRQVEMSRRVAAYAAAQHDRLDDFDVIVALDSLGGESDL